MNKKELLEGHNKEEQILISKMIDKMEEAKQKNKLTIIFSLEDMRKQKEKS